jgi:hypothetical protein
MMVSVFFMSVEGLAQPDTLWTRTFGGTFYDFGNYVQETSDGGFILLGYTQSFGNFHCDFWLIKTDSEGNKFWDRNFGGDDHN